MNDTSTPKTEPRGSSLPLRIAFVLLVLAAVGFLAMMFVRAYQAAASRAHRFDCPRNLRQLVLALHNYHEVYHSFPPAYIADANGKPMHSWRVLIMPFLEQSRFYEVYDMDEPWNGPHNRRLVDGKAVEVTEKDGTRHSITFSPPGVFRCPKARPSQPAACTNYVMVVGPGTISSGTGCTTLNDFRDGTSETIAIAEIADSNIHWMEPRDLRFDQMSFQINDRSKPSISSHHPGGVYVAKADGSVVFLGNDTPPAQLKAMLTVHGSDTYKPQINTNNRR